MKTFEIMFDDLTEDAYIPDGIGLFLDRPYQF
jgi:hypothetical protein